MEAVTAYAEEQSQRIHQEVEDFKAKRLYEAEQQALQAAYEMIQRENAGMRSNLRRDLSRRELDERRHLLEKRQGLMEDVFAGAEEKLREYTATPAYRERLRQSVSEVVGRLTEEGRFPSSCILRRRIRTNGKSCGPFARRTAGWKRMHPSGWAASGGRTGFAA